MYTGQGKRIETETMTTQTIEEKLADVLAAHRDWVMSGRKIAQ